MNGLVAESLAEGLELLAEDLGHARQDVDVPDQDRREAHRLAADELGALGDLGHAWCASVSRPRKYRWRMSTSIGWRATCTAIARATPSMVTSSCVGPTPPEVKTTSKAPAERGDLVGDQRDLVRDDGDAPHVDAERAELAAEVGRVRVPDLAREDLVADEDDSRGLRHDESEF